MDGLSASAPFSLAARITAILTPADALGRTLEHASDVLAAIERKED
jgi:hypothetical protein